MMKFVSWSQIYEVRFRHVIYIAKVQQSALYSIDFG